VSTALADPPHASDEQPPPTGGDGRPSSDRACAPAARACESCGAVLAGEQDWCLSCGAGAPGSLGSRAPSWRSAATVLTVLAVLVLGAAGAAYAALSKGNRKPTPATTTVAQAVAPATTAPTATVPTTSTPAAPTPTPGTPTTIKPVTPLPKAAKIPLTPTVTPTPAATTPAATTPSNALKTTPTTPGGSGEASGEGSGSGVVGEAHPEALLLDTNAAATYNPYNYPASNFGDPSLTIDGDPSTGWTALVEPSVAPKLAEGVVIDLNTARKLSAVALTTSTPGMTVQLYGSVAATLPSSITDPAWVALTPAFIEHKRHVRTKLGAGGGAFALAAKQPYRYIVLWISQAPQSSVGTPQAPGHVSVNELELFPFIKKK
jgi:hypothetical protein